MTGQSSGSAPCHVLPSSSPGDVPGVHSGHSCTVPSREEPSDRQGRAVLARCQQSCEGGTDPQRPQERQGKPPPPLCSGSRLGRRPEAGTGRVCSLCLCSLCLEGNTQLAQSSGSAGTCWHCYLYTLLEKEHLKVPVIRS